MKLRASVNLKLKIKMNVNHAAVAMIIKRIVLGNNMHSHMAMKLHINFTQVFAIAI